MRPYWMLWAAAVGLALLSGCVAGGERASEPPRTASGFIEARTTTLSAEVSGRVAEVHHAQGSRAEVGAALLRLEWADLAAARRQAQAGIQAAEGTLNGLEGQPDSEALAAAEAEVARARAELEMAAAQEALLRSSYEPAEPPDEQLHAAQGAVNIARAGLDLALALQAQVEAGPRPEELEVARAGLAEARAGLDLVELQAERLTIYAPLDGTISQVFVHPGEVVLPGTPLVLLRDSSELRLTVFIPVGWLGRVNAGDEVLIRVDAYPGETFQGRVLQVADQAQFTPTSMQTTEERVKQVFQVIVQLADTGGRLKPGMPADAEFAQP